MVGKYPRVIDKRHRIAWRINVRGPNVFAGLPYGRKLRDRELALISFLMLDGKDLDFTSGMTISDAIDQERRRMAITNRRVRLPRKR